MVEKISRPLQSTALPPLRDDNRRFVTASRPFLELFISLRFRADGCVDEQRRIPAKDQIVYRRADQYRRDRIEIVKWLVESGDHRSLIRRVILLAAARV